MNNNIIPACIIGAGLFAVALKPAPQPAPIPQAEPVAVATASVTGPSEPVIVWYGTTHMSRQTWVSQIQSQGLYSLEHGLMEQLKPNLLLITSFRTMNFAVYRNIQTPMTALTVWSGPRIGLSSPPPKWPAEPTSTATERLSLVICWPS